MYIEKKIDDKFSKKIVIIYYFVMLLDMKRAYYIEIKCKLC